MFIIVSIMAKKTIEKRRRKQDLQEKYSIRIQAGKAGLVEATSKMDIHEFRVFATMLTMVLPEDEDFCEYEIRVQDIMKLFSLNMGGHYYEIIKDAAQRMMDRKFVFYEMQDGEEYKRTIHLIDETSEPVRKERQNHIRLKFNPKLKPFLLQLRREYLTIDVRNIVDMQSPYSVKLYMILKHQQNLGNKKVKYFVTQLRQMLAIEEGEYPLYGSFKQQILRRAIGDIEKFTDLRISRIEEEKAVRSVVAIIFFIEPKVPPRQIELSQKGQSKKVIKASDKPIEQELQQENNQVLSVVEIYEQVKKYKISKNTVEGWVKKIEPNQIKLGIDFVLNEIKEGKAIKNIGGYINQMVKTTSLSEVVSSEKDVKEKKRSEIRIEQERQQKEAQIKERQDKLLSDFSEAKKALFLATVSEDATLYKRILHQLQEDNSSDKRPILAEMALEQYNKQTGGEITKQALLDAIESGGFSLYAYISEWFDANYSNQVKAVFDEFKPAAERLGVNL